MKMLLGAVIGLVVASIIAVLVLLFVWSFVFSHMSEGDLPLQGRYVLSFVGAVCLLGAGAVIGAAFGKLLGKN